MNEIITTYEPDNSLKKGYLSIFGEIYNELKRNKWLTCQLFKRDFFALYKQSFIGILWVPLIIIPIMLLTLGLGFILSFLNGVMRDIGNMLSMLMTFLMFLTPVLYAKPTAGILARITEYNPLYYLVSAPRDLVLMGTVPELQGFLIANLISLIIFLICLIAFHLTETRITERV